MAKPQLDKTRLRFYCSSSISNFKEKLAKRTGLKEYRFFRDWRKKTIFFGLYHELDYIKFLLHGGEKTVFWCGGDILNLMNNPNWRFWASLLSKSRAKHFCENGREAEALLLMDIYTDIRPMIFDEPPTALNFKPIKNVLHVYISAHEGKEEQYGVDFIVNEVAPQVKWVVFHIYGVDGLSVENVIYHGKVSNEEFNEDIKGYHCAIRWNYFDGFSEVLAKAVLMGQYAISRIWYPHMGFVPAKSSLIPALKRVRKKKEPNQDRIYWQKELENNLNIILS